MTQIGNGSSDNRLAVVSYDNNVVVRVGSSVKTLNAGQVYYFGAVNAGTSIKTDNPNHTIACYAWCYSKYWTRGVTLAPLD